MTAARIMIVDNSATIRAMLEQVISADVGCRVVGMAADAGAALRLMTSIWPDVMTLDLTMPGIDGFAFLEAVRDRRHPPIVVISSRSTIDGVDTARALAAGAVACFDKAELLSDVPRFLRRIKQLAVPRKMPITRRRVHRVAIDATAMAWA